MFVVGGYGLDALYGKLTRNHDDIDLFIYEKDMRVFNGILNNLGFQATGNVIGTVGKTEFSNTEFPNNFTIEYGTFENGLKLLNENDRPGFVPIEPLGNLNGYKIWTPTLEGFKKIIEINNLLAAENNEPIYPHVEWVVNILNSLEEKFNK